MSRAKAEFYGELEERLMAADLETDTGRVAGRSVARVSKTHDGSVAEWFKALVLKTSEPKGSVGSNPTASATYLKYHY